MKRFVVMMVIAVMVIATLGNGVAVAEDAYDESVVNAYAASKVVLDAYCVLYELGGEALFPDEYIDKVYWNFKLYFASQAIYLMEMQEKIESSGEEIEGLQPGTLTIIDHFVNEQYYDYVNGTITKSEYLAWMMDVVREQIGESTILKK